MATPTKESYDGGSRDRNDQPFRSSGVTSIRPASRLEVSLPLRRAQGRCARQSLELVDRSSLECAQQLSPDRRGYGEAERRVQGRANRHPGLRRASPRCQHSQLEYLRSYGQIACAYDRRPPQLRSVPGKAVKGGLQTYDG